MQKRNKNMKRFKRCFIFEKLNSKLHGKKQGRLYRGNELVLHKKDNSDKFLFIINF